MDVLTGYLDGFDPDFIVKVGDCNLDKVPLGGRVVISDVDLLSDVNSTHVPKFGIGLLDLVDDYFDKELKFKRNDGIHVAYPEFPRAFRTFLAAVFGGIPREAESVVRDSLLSIPGATHVKPNINNFFDLWVPMANFPRHITTWALERKPMRDAIIFLCDAGSAQDIIDFWNLRASGKYVVPIPVQVAKQESVKKFAREFIRNGFVPYRNNPNLHSRATIQKSRTIGEDDVDEFCKSLDMRESGAEYVVRKWYPRLWNSWARGLAPERIDFPYSHEYEHRLSEDDNRLEIKSLNPKFQIGYGSYGEPKFANDFEFRFYGSKEPMAEVIPEGSQNLSSAFGRYSLREWRFSKRGPSFLATHADDLIFLDLPRAELVMTEWFKERGWEVSLSGAGRIATQLVKQVGGAFGSSWLAHKGLIDLLGALEVESGMTWQAVVERLRKVVLGSGLLFDAERYLETLLEANAIKLGARIQCPVCIRQNWYELDAIKYTLGCRYCLANFSPPTKSPKEIVWAYRANGPFASSNAQGSFTVLLTLNFLRRDYDRAITPIFSYDAKKDGKVLEADLSCLYKKSKWNNSDVQIVHAECKSFNSFERRDVQRMADLRSAFPGSVLIFSCLKEKLDGAEAKLIESLVNQERRKRLKGDVYSPVIVLTGVELFSQVLGKRFWEGKGSIYEEFSNDYFDASDLEELADATQKIYLGMPSWSEWSNAKRASRRA